jgi:hypothetical protein
MTMVKKFHGRPARFILDEGTPPREVLESGLIAGMSVVGVRFRDGEMFVPEVLLSAQAMQKAMEILRPLLGEGAEARVGKVVISTVYDFALFRSSFGIRSISKTAFRASATFFKVLMLQRPSFSNLEITGTEAKKHQYGK